MSEDHDGSVTRIALQVSRDRNRSLLQELLSDYDVVDFAESVPSDTDLCIVDDRAISGTASTLTDWKEDQAGYAPVLLLSTSNETNPWERYAALFRDRIDAIQPIPAPKVAIRARVESLLETRQYSLELASERQLVERIFETSPIAKTVLDTDGNIVRANKRAEEVLGLSQSELTERAFDTPEWKIIDENGDRIPSEELPFSRVAATGEPVYGYEHGIERPDGERAWLSVSLAPLYDESGDIEYVVSAIEDVTERERLERELRQSEELHRATLSNITDTVFITDEAGRFTYVCPNVHFIFGYTADEVREMGTVTGLLGDDPASDGVSEGEMVDNVELHVTDVEGDEHTVLVTVTPVSIQGGTRLYSVRDVTQLVQSERSLKLERERLETVVSNAPLILSSIDSDGTITLNQGRQLEQIGFEPGELEGKSVDEAFGDVPEILDSAERVLDGETFRTTTRVGDRFLEAWHQPIFENGDVDHAIVVALDITDRKRQEERFQAFVEGSSDIITVLNSEGVVEYVSPSVEHILGYDPADLVDANVFELIHPADREEIVGAFAGLTDRTTGATFTKRYRTKHADGTWRWTESRTTKREGMTQGTYVVNTRDVTEQVAAERELRRTEESRSLALKASGAGVWEWDMESDDVIWHESTEKLFGMEPGTFEGTYEAFSRRIHPEDRPELEVTIQRAIERKGTFHMEFRIIREDGQVRWLEGRGKVLTDAVGNAERMLGVDVDITERKERERLLRRTQRAIEASGHAVHITDPEGVIEYVNPAFEESTGYRREEVIGESMRILHSEAMSSDHYAEMWSTIRAGDIWDEETIIRRKGGGTYHVSQTVAPITDDDGALEGFVAIQTDITDHKDRLQQLRVMDRVLRHNLRNDMNVIRGYGEMIREAGSDPISTYGDTIVEYSDDLLDLTDKQREITEILSSEPHLVPIDTVSTIRRIAATARQEYPDATVDLDLPDHATARATDGLDRAIEELVTNAITHADRDAEVAIHVEAEDETVEIRIADTGPGIPAMERRVVTGERDIEPLHHGSGLGLWLVSWIVRRSEGTLRFEENEPRGTVAVITLGTPTHR